MGWIPSRLGVVLIQCCVVVGNRFSKVDFVHKGFVQYGINGHVIKELSVRAELRFPKCSQECLLENDCVGFEICDVSSSPLTCRLVHMSPEFVGADSGQCQHFGKDTDMLYTCAGYPSVSTCLSGLTAPSRTVAGSYLDCSDCNCVAMNTLVSGVYEIAILGDVILVNCVIKDGHGYTVVLQRSDGSVNFNRTYTEYETGFGSPFTEVWLGNKYLHELTSKTVTEMVIELRYSDSSFRYVDYLDVYVGGASSHFLLLTWAYSGNASNMMNVNNSRSFGANDLDPSGCKCPMLSFGGWWHDCCATPCGLTMPYNDPIHPFGWECGTESTVRLTSATMMVRKG
ncbi:angiopoietin-related protein 7-like [Crassostrea virginica]